MTMDLCEHEKPIRGYIQCIKLLTSVTLETWDRLFFTYLYTFWLTQKIDSFCNQKMKWYRFWKAEYAEQASRPHLLQNSRRAEEEATDRTSVKRIAWLTVIGCWVSGWTTWDCPCSTPKSRLLCKPSSPGEIIFIFFHVRTHFADLRREADLEGSEISFWRNKTWKGFFQGVKWGFLVEYQESRQHVPSGFYISLPPSALWVLLLLDSKHLLAASSFLKIL